MKELLNKEFTAKGENLAFALIMVIGALLFVLAIRGRPIMWLLMYNPAIVLTGLYLFLAGSTFLMASFINWAKDRD